LYLIMIKIPNLAKIRDSKIWKRREELADLYIFITLIAVVIKALIVWHYIGRRSGVNFNIYFGSEVISSYIEAWATAKALVYLIEERRKKALQYFLLASACFVGPEIYVLIANHSRHRGVPIQILAPFLLFIFVSFALFLVSLSNKAKRAKE
jgi:hypothetical protein